MTTAMSNQALRVASNPSTGTDANPHAFRYDEISASIQRPFLFDTLREGMATGRIGGVPLSGAMPDTLLMALEALHWRPDIRELAGAMPHFPDNFDLTELRNVLRRLGFTSHIAHLYPGPPGTQGDVAFAIDPGGSLELIQMSDDKASSQLTTRRPGAVHATPLDPNTRVETLVIERAEDDYQDSAKDNWTGDIRRRFNPMIRWLMVLIFISNLLVVISSFWIITLFDTAIPAKAYDTLSFLLVGLTGLFALDLWVRRVRANIISRISGRLEFILGTNLFARLMQMPIEMLTTSPVSDQINRLRQFETVRDFFSGPLVAVLLELPFLTLLLGVIAYLSPTLGVITCLFVLVYALIGMIIYPKLSFASAQMARNRTEHQRMVLECLRHREQIARTGLGDVMANRLAARATQAGRSKLKLDKLNRIMNSIASATTPLAAGTVIVVGAALAAGGQMSGGSLIAITILIWRLLAPVQQAMLVAARLPELLNLLRQIDKMMAFELPSPSAGTTIGENFEGRIEVEGLVLRYPRALSPALMGVSFKAEPGSLTVITGPAGSGKTSMLRALSGHFGTQAGTILLGGINLNQISHRQRASLIGYATEQTLLFHGTVAQNLYLAAPEATIDDLSDLATRLGYIDQILALEKGFNTRLDFTARNELNTGLLAMISLSQVLLRKPRILLIDEMTVTLSPQLEDSMLHALLALRSKCTVMMVSRRPRHIGHADVQLDMYNGRIAYAGPPRVASE